MLQRLARNLFTKVNNRVKQEERSVTAKLTLFSLSVGIVIINYAVHVNHLPLLLQ